MRIAVEGNPTADETAAIVAAVTIADGGEERPAPQAARGRHSWTGDADTYDALRDGRRTAQRRAGRA